VATLHIKTVGYLFLKVDREKLLDDKRSVVEIVVVWLQAQFDENVVVLVACQAESISL
jgi:hypothetical protein